MIYAGFIENLLNFSMVKTLTAQRKPLSVWEKLLFSLSMTIN